ncbi:MAG: magnesium-translocating P-type ATPase [Bryobacterales bacterium]|nr:magnesium-translocating P-type ATPase [Bryobacterales bacterium]
MGWLDEAGSYWSRDVAALLSALESDAAKGLSVAAAAERLARQGPNALGGQARRATWRLLLGQFTNPLILILVFAAVVSAVAGEWVDATIVLLVVAGSGAMGFVQEYAAGSALERLRARVTLTTNVVRDGEAQAVASSALVPGDIILLSAGSLIPADGVLLDARDFFVNEAVLTGETYPVEKRPGVVAENAGIAQRTNCVFLGSNVRSGTARALVVQTGAATLYGQIAKRLTLRPPETEFERGLHHFGLLLTQFMAVLVMVVFTANILHARPALDSVLFAIALAVGLAPELLPVILTVTLSKGAQKMAAGGVIVRRLSAIENLGSMDVLCTDKTGTLTEGVVRLDAALDAEGQPSQAVLRDALRNAHFQTGLKNPLDEAIWAARGSLTLEGWRKVDEIPYDFIRKRLSVVVADGDGRHRLITKGALEPLLPVCGDIADAAPLLARYEEWSASGFRVLGVASKAVPPQPVYSRDDEAGLTFEGFLLFFDPPKEGTARALRDLASRHVAVKIVTGDSRGVAVHVAGEVGLPVDAVLTGEQLRAMGDEALWHAAERTTIFAGVDPNQKERIIGALRRTGHVVGFLGDGINDAPALHAADVGISVDQAVDVAKEAADLVLLEHDLDVLRTGIDEGRRTFANTIKYIFTTTSANFGNMLSMAGASLFLPFLPLVAKQILLNNFLSDIPGMCIAGDRVDDEWLHQPRRWNMHFLRRFTVVFGLVSALFDFLTFGVLLLVMQAGPEVFRTAWFIESLLTELAVALVVRTRAAFYRSKPGRALWMSTLAVGVLTLILAYTPLGPIFDLVPLPPRLLLLILAITGLYVLAAEAAKRWFWRTSGL